MGFKAVTTKTTTTTTFFFTKMVKFNGKKKTKIKTKIEI